MGFFKTLRGGETARPDDPAYLLIHDRVEWHVLALTEHLRRQGRSLFLFGPREYGSWPAVRRVGDANGASLGGESAALRGSFLKHYRHLSVNDQSYERFCFERWFLIHDFATSGRPFWYIDSDYLLAPSFPTPELPIDKLWDTAYVTPVGGAETIRGFVEYLLDIYRSGEYRTLAESHPVAGRPHMSDMYALCHYADENPARCHSIRRRAMSLGVCTNINHAGGHVTDEACRKVLMDPLHGTYHCIDRESHRLRHFHSLHFQGIAKILLPFFIDRDIMAMRFKGSSIADMYRRHLRSKKYWLESGQGRAVLAMMRSSPSLAVLGAA